MCLSLDHAVGSRVNCTTDRWISRHGQGRYISYTAIWVTLMSAGKDPSRGAPLRLEVPPHGVQGKLHTATSSFSTMDEPPLNRPAFTLQCTKSAVRLCCNSSAWGRGVILHQSSWLPSRLRFTGGTLPASSKQVILYETTVTTCWPLST